MSKFILPQGNGIIKKSRDYKSLKPNQKIVYDKVYDPINGSLFFAENCAYVNRNGLELYQPFDYQREMLFNLRNYQNIISLFSRQSGKCVCSDTKIKLKNKKSGEIIEMTIGEFFDLVKNNSSDEELTNT